MVNTKIGLRNQIGEADDLELCVENNYTYRYSESSMDADDDDAVVKPYNVRNDAAGRWLKVQEYQTAEL